MIDRERLLQTFLDLVRIDSETGYEAAAAAYCRARLAALGLTVEEDDAGPALGGDCGNLFAFLPARGADQPTIMVNAHLDTVVPGRGVQPVIEEGVVRSDGRTVLGADNKTGLAVILEALSVLQERRPPHAAVQVVLTVSEEVGLRGARHVARERLIADFGYTLDSDIVGGVVVRAPGYHRIDARIIGLAAHAGVHPEQGLSAAVIAARAVARTPLGKLDERTTANVGRLVAGVARNVVPAEARLEAEVRSHEPARLEEVTRQIVGILGEETSRAAVETPDGRVPARLELDVQREFEPFRLEPGSPVVRRAVSAYQRLGIEPLLRERMGGSDANIFNAKGLPTAVIATGQRRVHSLQEFVRIDELVLAARGLVEILTAAPSG
jgi:tripeptide aminopeptidase